MKITPLSIEGAWLAELPLYNDNRGSFREWFKHTEILEKTGFNFFVSQANISISSSGVVRGIHYSLNPEGQAKWVTCLKGAILDVVVDIRPMSPTFRRVEHIKLCAREGRAVLIGSGLGHGFTAIEDDSVVCYLLSSPFSPRDEYGINPFDEDLAIQWKTSSPIISSKDQSAPSLQSLNKEGLLPK
jgi:dTDP-4-dehydrorhamnose 3,5-epimerase